MAGFVWFQGFNDMVSRDVDPTLARESPGNRFAKYSDLMACFPRHVRKHLDAPKMPFVIGVIGVGWRPGKRIAYAMTLTLDRPSYWLLAACAICVSAQPSALAEKASPIRVACLGDSITAGARVTDAVS